VDGINEIGAWQLANRYTLDEPRLALLVDNAKGQPAQSVAALQVAKARLFRDEEDQALAMANAGCVAPIPSVRIANLCGSIYAIHAARLPVKTENLEAKENELTHKARAAYERALEIDGSNVESLLAASSTYRTLEGDYAKVRSGLESALDRDPTNPEIAYQLATLYRESDLKKTKLLLERSLANALDFDATERVQGFLHRVEEAIASQAGDEAASGAAH
jgi:tetratricopeptide (TPR) repeat protein